MAVVEPELHLFGMALGTPLQGVSAFALLTIVAGLIRVWISGIPERLRVSNETKAMENAEVALQLKEFRLEVHALRNELGTVRAELHSTQNQSARRGDKLNMVLFILNLVMEELSSRDPGNKVLGQAHKLLHGIEHEPPKDGQSKPMAAAMHTVQAAEDAVHELKAEEAKT